MIHVIAAIEVVEGKRDEFLEAFHELMPKVHEEKGCIEYGPTIDVPTDIGAQDPPRDNVVTILEKWDDVEALKAHLAAPHMGEYREKVRNLVAGVKLQIVEPA